VVVGAAMGWHKDVGGRVRVGVKMQLGSEDVSLVWSSRMQMQSWWVGENVRVGV
jgi:hypothetical protein